MNVHVNEDIRERWPSHEFKGKPRLSRYGFTYIKAYNKGLSQTQFYIFGADSFVDKSGLDCGAPELIFDFNEA